MRIAYSTHDKLLGLRSPYCTAIYMAMVVSADPVTGITHRPINDYSTMVRMTPNKTTKALSALVEAGLVKLIATPETTLDPAFHLPEYVSEIDDL